MYYLPDRRKPTPILTMEENTSNGVFNMLVGSGTGCNSVQQEMSSMVQRHVIQVKFFFLHIVSTKYKVTVVLF